MGNSRSQLHHHHHHHHQNESQQPDKSFCLLYLIRRSWKIVSLASGVNPVKNLNRDDDTDECATDFSTASRSCSLACAYQQELHFDSESDMAPNAEEDLLMTVPRGLHSAKERLRPPTYNAEDYAIALRRWGRKALGGTGSCTGTGQCNDQGTLPSTCTSSSSGYASAGNNNNAGEMTLRQFTSVSELLNKLKADLRLAFPSFVQEFSSPPADGLSLLLETLRGVQLSQSTPPGQMTTGNRRPRARRAALDELGCVECLAACADRCPDAGRVLAHAQPGLLALAVCLTSSLNRSRILALQLLTRVCQTPGGHGAVSEAVSTLRLRYGEGGRFRFLAGALLAPKAALALRVAGVSFLNAFLSTAPRAQTKLYIQAEACEAGLEPRALQEWLKYADDEDSMTELLREEVRKWSKYCIDVEALQNRARRAEETCRLLSKKVSALQQQLQKFQLERLNEYNSRQQSQSNSKSPSVDAQRDDGHVNSRIDADKKVSSSAEDEGISFSERSSSPEEQQYQQANTKTQNTSSIIDNDQETTIDDVIEELRIIVKDAEEEMHDWNHQKKHDANPKILNKSEFVKSIPTAGSSSGKNSMPSKARECLRNTEEVARLDRNLKTNSSLKIIVPGPQQMRDQNLIEDEDKESAIIPAIIHPQPPRRIPPCILGTPLFLQQPHNPTSCDWTLEQDLETPRHPVIEVCVDSEHDEDLLLLDDEDEGSDSLLSASRLNYHANLPKSLLIVNRTDDSNGIYRRRRRSLSSSEFKVESLADFEISETIIQPRQSNSLGSKQYSRCTNTVQRRTERRKYLRRCQSQDHIEQQHSDLKSSSRGVLEQIRKFESLNSFDDRRSLPNFDDTRLRRSESFHQTRITDAKSLDRIDEGLDAMVDIVVTRRRLSGDEKNRVEGRRHDSRRKQQRRDDVVSDDRKYTSFLDTRKDRLEYRERSVSAGRPHQQHHSDSRIFAGRPDVLGFGKNRFNAGKYSGNSHQQQAQQQFGQKNSHRHVNSSPQNHPRGKVTDMVSGLY